MEDVERQEAYYGKGWLYTRIGPQILLQCLNQRTNIIHRPPDDHGGTQGVRRSTEPQIMQIEGLLYHCGPKEVLNAR